MSWEKDLDIAKAKLINPFSKSLPLFHLRLLDEDTLCNIMSFLQTKQVLVMSSLNRYSRNLVKKFLQEYQIEIGKNSLCAERFTQQQPNRSIASKIFLPNDVSPPLLRDIMLHILKHPLLVENSRNVIVLSYTFPMDYYQTTFDLAKEAIQSFKNLKRLTVNEIIDLEGLIKHILETPLNLTYLCIEKDNAFLDHYRRFIFRLNSLEHLVLPFLNFSINPFARNQNLKIVEYRPVSLSGQEKFSSLAISWDQIKTQNPNIVFKERTSHFLLEEN